MNVREKLLSMGDNEYREFHSKLMPTVDKERIIGIRVPLLRKFAKEFSKTPDSKIFLSELPHYYYEENNLHAFIIEDIRDYALLIKRLDEFLPYVDNWATCDMLSPKIFKKRPDKALCEAKRYISSDRTYTIRFGIGLLNSFCLDEGFSPEVLEAAAKIKSDEYYVNMMTAWFFATALAKRYECALPYIEERRLPEWVHNKTIQKAAESRSISEERKAYLKSLKI